MRYRIMRNGMGQYYIQYRRFLLWLDYQTDMDATVTFPTEAKAVACVRRLMLERERPVLVREYPNPALAEMHLDDLAEAKNRVACAEAVLATIFGMYKSSELQIHNGKVTRAIQNYYDQYPFPMEDKTDE